MTAKYWTTGEDIWRLEERRVFDFKNLDTDEVVTCDCVTEVTEKNFTPIIMPKIKPAKPQEPTIVKETKAAKSSRRGPRAKSKYKGVNSSKTTGKFRVQFFDKKNKKNIGLGTFDSELLAAAAYQERIGDHKEARRLRNEYEEGNCRPEASEPQLVHNTAMQPSEE